MMRLCSLLLIFVCTWAHGEPLRVGDKAPNWLLSTTEGKAVSLYEQADAGKSTLMVFWSSWCKGCAELLPEIAKLKKSLASAPVTFYALNVWEDKPIGEFLQAHPMDIDIVVRADEVARRFGVGQTTAVIVVGEDKLLRYISPDDIAPAALVEQLRQVLQSPGQQKRQST